MAYFIKDTINFLSELAENNNRDWFNENKKRFKENVRLFDLGTSAFEVLFQLKGHDRIILVDAVLQSGEEPGTLFRLPANEVEAQVEEDPLVFLHGLKWHQALSYARKMLGEDYPREVEVFLIAIEDTRFNVGMSKPVLQGGDRLVDRLIQELRVFSLQEDPTTLRSI